MTLRLGLLYWAYFSVFGILFPYTGRYFRAFDYDFSEIGLILAALTGANVYAPFLIARLSDITGQRIWLARIAIMLVFVSVMSISPERGLLWSLGIAVLMGTGLSMALPQLEAIALESLGNNRHKYSLIRLWGSLGFVFTVLIGGIVMDQFGNQWFRYIQLIMLALLMMLTLNLPDQAVKADGGLSTLNSGIELLKHPAILLFFLVMLLNQVALAPYNSFADLYWQSAGLGSIEIGSLLALAPVAEAGFMVIIPLVLYRRGYFGLLVIAQSLTIIRWFLMAWFPDNLLLMLLAQLAHALTFGAMHGVAIFLIGQLFHSRQQGMGQSLYVSLATGGGLILGNLGAGFIWSNLQVPALMFISAGLLSIAGLILSLKYLRPDQLRHYLQH